MTKMIDLHTQKSRTLINALRKHMDEVADKGISAADLDTLENSLAQLEESSKVAEELRAKLSAQVKKTNEILAGSKATFNRVKKAIKDNYLQEEWATYGVPDKR